VEVYFEKKNQSGFNYRQSKSRFLKYLCSSRQNFRSVADLDKGGPGGRPPLTKIRGRSSLPYTHCRQFFFGQIFNVWPFCM